MMAKNHDGSLRTRAKATKVAPTVSSTQTSVSRQSACTASGQPRAQPVIFALDDVDAEMLEAGEGDAAVVEQGDGSDGAGDVVGIPRLGIGDRFHFLVAKHDDEEKVGLDQPPDRPDHEIGRGE